MLIENKTNLIIPVDFWMSLAKKLGLSGVLPLSIEDEFGLYEDSNKLRVLVTEFGNNVTNHEVILVSYTSGEIEIKACPRCTVSFLTYMLLDGLANAWLHQYHENLYERYNSEKMAYYFSRNTYQKLTSIEYTDYCRCQDFNVSIDAMKKRVQFYNSFVDEFVRKSDIELANLIKYARG